MSYTKVLIADHNTILREALKAILGSEDGILIAGEASTVEKALELISLHNPDVVMMSIFMPDKGSYKLVEKAREINPSLKFIVFSLGRTKEVKHLLFEMKVNGLLKANVGLDDIKLAVKTVSEGDTYIDPLITDGLFDGKIRQESKLSARQMQILKMISEGFTNKRISVELGISQDTVKTHVRIILKKLGAADRAQAVSKAYEFAIFK